LRKSRCPDDGACETSRHCSAYTADEQKSKGFHRPAPAGLLEEG
jgi:hypothetical protein